MIVAQSTADYLLADNIPVYSHESKQENDGLPYSLDFEKKEAQEDFMHIEAEFSKTYEVVRRGKKRGKGKGEYSFRIGLEYDLPEKIISGSSFLFKCTISKGDLMGSAKLTQRLPVGFDIVESVVGNAKTNYSNYTLSLVWDQIPADSVFEISYNVVVNRSYGYLPISSILYFEETGKKYLFNTHILVDKERPASDLVVYNPPDKDAEIILVETVKPKSTNSVMPSQKYSSPDIAVHESQSTGISEVNKVTNTRLVRKENVTIEYADVSKSYEKQWESGVNSTNEVVYRVQILALMYNNIEPENLQTKYNISENVKVEKFHNWRKYTIGNYTSFKNAKISLANLRKKGRSDAFIVGYKDGYRFLIQ